MGSFRGTSFLFLGAALFLGFLVPFRPSIDILVKRLSWGQPGMLAGYRFFVILGAAGPPIEEDGRMIPYLAAGATWAMSLSDPVHYGYGSLSWSEFRFRSSSWSAPACWSESWTWSERWSKLSPGSGWGIGGGRHSVLVLVKVKHSING